MVETISFRRRKLPHWRVLGRSYFATFRLSGTVPSNVLNKFRGKREKLGRFEDEFIEFQRYELAIIEKLLDSGSSSAKYLAVPEVASLVIPSFQYVERAFGWRFPSLVVMPNHVHCLCCGETAKLSLDRTFRKFKGYTA